jgi:hypothetical protein
VANKIEGEVVALSPDGNLITDVTSEKIDGTPRGD